MVQGGGAADARGQGQHRRQRPLGGRPGMQSGAPAVGNRSVKDTASITPRQLRETASSFSLLLRAAKTTSAQQGGQPGGQGQQRADSGGFQHSSIPDSLCGSYYSTQADLAALEVPPAAGSAVSGGALAASMASTIIRAQQGVLRPGDVQHIGVGPVGAASLDAAITVRPAGSVTA